MAPCAVPVFHFNAENKLCLNDAMLKVLNHQKIANKRVCVISIAGAFRQGKYFIQNFLIRYLNLKYKLKIRDMSLWLDPKHGPISGFTFKAGSARQTIGILMWSEIFLANLPSGEEVAIILMDTQGAFDNVTTLTNCSTIFALSTLISSVQIYNLKENIKQDDLQHLEVHRYGQLALDEESETPFQKLLFLIRDWSFVFEKNFGFGGGKELLNEALNIEEGMSEELIALKNGIKESFEDVGCFLMPHPGKVVASSETFQGNIDEIDPDFRTQVEIFASAILAPENLVLKTVNAQTITVKGLVDLIKTYWDCFKDGKLPPVKSLYLTTAELHHTVAKQEAVQEFKKLIKNCKSLEEASYIMTQALNFFRQRKKLGSSAISKKYEELLIKELKELFSKKQGWRHFGQSMIEAFGGVGVILTGAFVAISTGGVGIIAVGAAMVAFERTRWMVQEMRKKRVVDESPVVEEASNVVVEEVVFDTTECEVTDNGRTEVVQAIRKRRMVSVLSLEGSNEVTDDERTESHLKQLNWKQNPKQEVQLNGQDDVSFPNENGIVAVVICVIIVVIYNIVLWFLQR